MIGERLAEIRKDHGDTQKTLAEKMNVVVHTVSSWEQEKSEPNHEMLVRLCRLYNTSSDYLLGLSDADPILERQSTFKLDADDQLLIKEFRSYLQWRKLRHNKKRGHD